MRRKIKILSYAPGSNKKDEVIWKGFKLTAPRVINLDDLVTRRKSIVIEFDYPLSHNFAIEFKRFNGFRVRDMVESIRKGYRSLEKYMLVIIGEICILRNYMKRNREDFICLWVVEYRETIV